ncbi:MAG: DUF1015 domain-containing protein [Lachnospiraceae bacterium]|nr:DUF1015 domain-containing protein [Lachnospiraceae bacterium]
MATVKPFCAIRPVPEKAKEIAALPYDVYTRKEAKMEIANHPLSFLRIDRAETNFDDSVGTYEPQVYQKADELLQQMIADGDFIREEEPRYYLYELTMDGRVQSGIVGCVSVDDYENGVVKRHENTRADKEQDRISHVDTTSAQTGPIFLAHRHNNTIEGIIKKTKENEQPVYDFTSDDGIRHRVFVIRDGKDIDNITFAFGNIPEVYIADGHHRAASAIRVSQMRRASHPRQTGREEYNYFLSVLFSQEELRILDYNRVVKDLNWLTPAKVLAAMEKHATLLREDFFGIHPEKKGQFSMFMADKWYLYEFHEDIKNDDPVEGMDVSLLQKYILEPVFAIGDPSKDKRIGFVGGIRGLEGLESRCEKDNMKVAFAMYPTSMDELFAVADAGLLMPPKSTWFEPKLRSGLFIHEIERE